MKHVKFTYIVAVIVITIMANIWWGLLTAALIIAYVFNENRYEAKLAAENPPPPEPAGPDWSKMTASERRMSDLVEKGTDEREQHGWIYKTLDFFFEFNKTPVADIHIDQTDYLLDPRTVGHIPAKLANPEGVFCGKLNLKPLHIGIEDRAVIIGPPGTGKTAFLVTQLMNWAKTKRPFVCLDIKPEIWAITRESLEREGYRVLVFNPTDDNTMRYNVLADLHTAEAIGELVANLITGTNEENAVFYETARDLLDCMIGYLKERDGDVTLPDVRALLGQFESGDELLSELKSSGDELVSELASELKLIADNDKLFSSVVASLRAGLRFIRYPAVKNALSGSDFSLADLCGQQPVALFLQLEEGKSEMLQRLTAMMIGHIMRYLIDHTNRQPVLLMLDEIGNAKGVTGLISKLNTIRSRRLPTWMFWQSSSQMGFYSENDANGRELIFGACDFVGVFRLNDNDTAQYISDKIGTVQRLITTYQESFNKSTSKSMSAGGGDPYKFGQSGGGGDSLSIGTSSGLNHQRSKQLQEEAIIKPHELQELPDGQMVCMYRGESWKGEATPYYKEWPEFNGVKPASVRPEPKPEPEHTPVPEIAAESPVDVFEDATADIVELEPNEKHKPII